MSPGGHLTVLTILGARDGSSPARIASKIAFFRSLSHASGAASRTRPRGATSASASAVRRGGTIFLVRPVRSLVVLAFSSLDGNGFGTGTNEKRRFLPLVRADDRLGAFRALDHANRALRRF